MDRNYTKAQLLRFLETLADKGLANANTAEGMRVATTKLLEDVDDSADVRELDLDSEIHRFHNRNPGRLTHSSVTEYGRRVKAAVKHFESYTENPAAFKPIGRGLSKKNGAEKKEAREAKHVGKPPVHSAQTEPELPQQGVGLTRELTHSFPLRADFLARVSLPTDLKRDEARRLAAFIATLAADFEPLG